MSVVSSFPQTSEVDGKAFPFAPMPNFANLIFKNPHIVSLSFNLHFYVTVSLDFFFTFLSLLISCFRNGKL
jgi:hypothetical protein